MAERNPLCNCDAPMPAALCTAVCFERRDDVASVSSPVTGNNPHLPAGDSCPVTVNLGGCGDRVLFDDPPLVAETSMSFVPSDAQHHAGTGGLCVVQSRQGVGNG